MMNIFTVQVVVSVLFALFSVGMCAWWGVRNPLSLWMFATGAIAFSWCAYTFHAYTGSQCFVYCPIQQEDFGGAHFLLQADVLLYLRALCQVASSLQANSCG